MTNTKAYADHVGRKVIADVIGVGLTAVSAAVVAGHFPAAWFKALRDAGLEPPEHLFNWKGVHLETSSRDADGSLACPDKVIDGGNDCKGAA